MASFLTGLGNLAGGAVKAGLSTYEQLEAMDKAEREKKAYEEQQAYMAELKSAAAPATAEQRQGLQVTGPDNKTFYIPENTPEAGREAYTKAGYTVGNISTPYQEMTTSRMAPGDIRGGAYREQQGTDTPARRIEADSAMLGYNAPGAGLGRQRDIALKYGKFSEAGALDTLAEAPERKKALGLNIRAAEQSIESNAFKLNEQQRTETNNKNVDAVSVLMAQAEALPPGSEQRVRIEGEIKAKTAGLPVEIQSSIVQLAKNKMELKRVQSEEAYIKAAATPEAFVAHYNSELRDGSTARIIKNNDGTTSIVTSKDGDEANTQERFRFKAWSSKERNQVLEASPAFAKAKFEADIAHSNKIEQLQVTGRLANERTAMIVRGKEIKMSPETRTQLMDINKKRTDLLSKGEALTPADEKELQKLDIQQESVVGILAIENNQIAALLRSGDSRYRTDNPPPRAAGRQSELNPAEYDAAKEQLRTRLAAERGSSFTGMNRNQQETYLNQEMDKLYVRKGQSRGLTRPESRFPAQGATTRDSSSNAATDIAARLRAARDADLAAE
jgi:hypothetical protein